MNVNLEEELIRDRIVVGIRDDPLSYELQAKAILTLDLAKQIARQAEARAENQPIIRGETVVSAVHRSKPHFQTTKGTHRDLQNKPADQRNMHKCGYCGKEPHPKHKCPARSAECAFCKKKGHYKAVCRKRLTQVREVDDHDTEEDFLGQILQINNVDKCSWSADVKINGEPHSFKLDTGASVSVLDEDWARSHQVKLQKTSKGLKGLEETRLTVLGCIEAELEYNGKSMKEILFVIKGQHHALLSRTACTTLGLVARVQTVNDSLSQPTPDFRAEFPSQFKGLGRIDLKYQYSISLKPDIQPVLHLHTTYGCSPSCTKSEEGNGSHVEGRSNFSGYRTN